MMKARFVRVSFQNGTNNHNESYWEVFDEEGKVVFVITVNQITNTLSFTYDEIATKKFGVELIKKVRASMEREAQIIAARELETNK
jgi:hypothetical protein